MADCEFKSLSELAVAWREAEQAAAAAEKDVALFGALSASPHALDLLLERNVRRREADRQFAALLRALPADEFKKSGTRLTAHRSGLTRSPQRTRT